jgi:hypothetical protein
MSHCSDFASVGAFNWRAELDEKRALELIRTNTYHEFIAYFPLWTDYLMQVKAKYDDMCGAIDTVWKDLDTKFPDPRDFGQNAKEYPNNNLQWLSSQDTGAHFYFSN